ncbi:MAG: hypothetical protein HY978_04980 [Candidatus Liptonbacteria bacterium]|nr:hypothetical protein [Candidatus Liptonbacteria bacterium]
MLGVFSVVAGRKSAVTRVSSEAAAIVAASSGGTLQAVTYLCVSDYVGGTRWRMQAGCYALTLGEQGIFARAHALREACRSEEISLRWQVILADGWGIDLYGDRVAPGSLDSYCAFMTQEAEARGFTTVRWSTLTDQNRSVYDRAVEQVRSKARELAPWEATKGEIAHDKPAASEALGIAEEHICMRAAESAVVVADRGATLVLSTEGPGLVRYDNLIVPRASYTHLYTMPFLAHRLP